MALIDFYIRNQKLSKTAPTLVADSINYVNCSFTFKTDDWNGFDKWVVFSKGQENYRVDLIDDAIPKEAGLNLGEGLWSVSVFGENPEGTERITTNSVTVEVAKSTIQNGEPLPPISLTEAEQISAKAQLALNAANEVLAKAESGEFNGAPGKDGENATPEQIAEAGEDYFEENPIPGGAEVTAESIEEALGYTPADEADIPTKTSDLTNDSGFITADDIPAAEASEEVYIGEEEPTDSNVKLWIKPSEEATGSGSGSGATALPNPFPLTFSGAVTASYDGSEEVNVEIPSGGGIKETIVEETFTESITAYEYPFTDADVAKINSAKSVRFLLISPTGTTGLQGITFGIYRPTWYSFPEKFKNNGNVSTGNVSAVAVIGRMYDFIFDRDAGVYFDIDNLSGHFSNMTAKPASYVNNSELVESNDILKLSTTTESGFPIGTTVKVEVIV